MRVSRHSVYSSPPQRKYPPFCSTSASCTASETHITTFSMPSTSSRRPTSFCILPVLSRPCPYFCARTHGCGNLTSVAQRRKGPSSIASRTRTSLRCTSQPSGTMWVIPVSRMRSWYVPVLRLMTSLVFSAHAAHSHVAECEDTTCCCL